MKQLIILLLFALSRHTASYLCSAFCGLSQCSGPTSSDCMTSCPTHWTLSGSSCQPDSSSSYSQIAASSDVAGSSVLQITPSSQSNTCGSYTYNGDYSCSTSFQIQLAAGIGVPHYSIQTSMWVIFTDSSSWASTNQITLQDGGNQQLYQMGSSGASESACNNLTQTYFRVALSQTHINSTSTPLSLTLSNDVINSGCYWGIKQVVVIAQTCHAYCLTCNGPLNTQCYTCAASYYLSGNTCSSACITGYGQVTSSYVCVLCDLKCSACAQTATNCSACTTTSPNQAFLSGTSCGTTCPTTTFANPADHKCDTCPSNCDVCSSSSVCTSCSSGYGLLGASCYNPCPGTYYMNGGSCSSCDPKRAVCAVSSTNCSQCTSSGSNQAYLSGSSCVVSSGCPTSTFANTADHKCDACPSNCYVCTSASTCTTCANNYGLLTAACYNPCPGATYNNAGVCTPCDSKCTLCSNSSTNCSQCSNTSPNIAYLSGIACVVSCPGGTYSSSGPNQCLSCDGKCSACSGSSSSQCSGCTTSGANEAFLTGSSCVIATACPTTTFANPANHKCDACPTNCDACTSSTVCTTCSSTYGLLSSSCYNPCPATYYMNSGVCSSCDSKCASCTGGLDSQCQSCNSGSTLSGSTCAASCLTNYGASSTARVCLSCNAYCSACNLLATNCSACTTSGPNQAFLNSAATPTPTCVVAASCPTTTFANAADHTCDACDSSCNTCSVSATNCTSCPTGKGWLNYACYASCPGGSYMNGSNCSSCDSLCKLCSNSSTNCSQCQTTSPNTAYLSANTCLVNCPAGQFNDNNGGAGPNVCTPCTSACTQCQDATTTKCQACSVNFTLSGTVCSSSCLSGYGPSSTPNVCISCTLPCLTCNLSATNCTTCDMSGGTLFLYNSGGNIYTCVANCPASTYKNMSTPSCDPCPTGCYECANKSYCYSCNYAAGYMWVNTTHLCYKPCPGNFYNSSSTNCSACLIQCYHCTNSPDNCTQCQTSGPQRGFLLGSTCFEICFSGYYGNVTTNTCQPCDANCANCFNSTKHDCSICNNPFVLSGTTCDTACQPQYGLTNDPYFCVACNATCLTCSYQSTNCSTCQTTGNFTAYLYIQNSTYSQCLETCPTGYFANTSTHTCEICNLNCTACTTTANTCTACQPGFGLLSSKCYQPCPNNYYKNGLLCSKCNSKCLLCNGSSTNCQACVISGANMSYLLNSTCYTTCPAGYYTFDNNTLGPTLCLTCDTGCAACTGTSSNCSACTANYYLFIPNTCVTTCPKYFFAYNATRTCIDSRTVFVTLNIDMYFSTSSQDQIYVDLAFDRDLDTNSFPLTTFQSFTFSDPTINSLNFTFDYAWLNSSSYRITITPSNYIFIYNCTVAVSTIGEPDPVQTSADGVNFDATVYEQTKDVVWFCIYASQSMKALTDAFSATSDAIREFTTLPFVQEINKAGIISMLFPGTQITSSIVVTNKVYSPHFYEASRLFANLVYFQAPNWQKNGSKTKYVVAPSASNLVSNYRLLPSQRLLFDVSSTYWRYQRTGFTTFFVIDCYTQLIMIAVVWLLVAVGTKMEERYKLRLMPKIYPIFHAAHQVMVFYFAMGLVLEWTYFDSSSPMRYLSLAVAILANVYLLAYVLYIYYKMIDYSALDIGSQKYRELTLKYGPFVRNLRYQEYQEYQGWSPKHLFRTYNYHLLSFYKKFLMIVSLPIFYDYPTTLIGVLIALQIMEMVRFCVTWPYANRKRNFFRLFLQIMLLLFFVTTLVQALLVADIQQNNAQTIGGLINKYYITGWIGVIFIFVFNLSCMAMMLVNVVKHCRKSNMEKIRQVRRNYYYQKLTKYENSLENNITVDVLDSWVAKGDLNQKWIEDDNNNTTLRLAIEKFIINKMSNGFTIQVQKIAKAEARAPKFGYLKQKVKVLEKIEGTIGLTKRFSKGAQFFRSIEQLFQKYDPEYKANFLTLKTIAKINTSGYLEGDTINFNNEQLSQVLILSFDADKKETEQLQEPLHGFPIDSALLKQIVQENKRPEI